MEQIQGTIDSIYTKDVQIKNGPRAGQTSTVYHAMINGIDVNCGFECSFVQGETVTLNVEQKYGGYNVLKGNQPAQSKPAHSAGQAVAPTPIPAPRPAFPTPKNTKDISIIRQNSMTHATRIVKDMQDLGILSKIMKEEDYIEKVIEVAYTIADFSTGWREEKQAAIIAAYEGDK